MKIIFYTDNCTVMHALIKNYQTNIYKQLNVFGSVKVLQCSI